MRACSARWCGQRTGATPLRPEHVTHPHVSCRGRPERAASLLFHPPCAAGETPSAARRHLEDAPAGTRWHAVADEGIALRELADRIAARLGVVSRSVPDEQLATHFGFLAPLIGMDLATSSAGTRHDLGWQPSHAGLLADLDAAGYFRDAT